MITKILMKTVHQPLKTFTELTCSLVSDYKTYFCILLYCIDQLKNYVGLNNSLVVTTNNFIEYLLSCV